MRCTIFFGCALWLCLSHSATAHDYWDGKNCGPGKQNSVECKVPDWVKSTCCGPADAHHLTPDQVIDHGDYYTIERVDGFPNDQKIPEKVALPSEDGDYWIFFSPYSYAGSVARTVYCLFVPFAG